MAEPTMPTELITGVMADPVRLNAHLTQAWAERWNHDKPVAVHPDAFRTVPTGNRLLVVVDPVPDRYGQLYLPETHAQAEQMGIATVMGAGAGAGHNVPYPGGPVLQGPPEAWLYRTVIIGKYIGKPIRFDLVKDADYTGSVMVIADRDVWCLLDG